MRVSRIRVRNIRSYLEASLELAPGTTLLVGDVGAGKTSLLYAVEMALFGTAEIEATFLVRHGASEAEVEVTLEDGEHRYQILRSFRRVRRKGKETFEPGADRLPSGRGDHELLGDRAPAAGHRAPGLPRQPEPASAL